MQEGNAGTAGAAADPRRYRFRTGRFGFCEGGLEIVDADADMVNAGAPSVEEAGDGRFRGQGASNSIRAGPAPKKVARMPSEVRFPLRMAVGRGWRPTAARLPAAS